MKLIERPAYLERIQRVNGIPDIKVITGVRRCGKSKLMEEFAKSIRVSETNANIIHINFNLLEFEPLLEYHKLHQYVEDAYQNGKHNYVLIDEIQMCESFEKAINSVYWSVVYL